ncbi:MAG TPA: cation:proton antiporter [Acidimicrobiales bacterium]|nr:cation:proton antiporter [Acidimicrobiales bacterium]
MSFSEVCVIAAALIGYGLVSRRIAHWPVSMPMVFVALGSLAEVSGLVVLAAETAQVAVLAEITLAVILFGDAVRINVRSLGHDLALPGRLLLAGLPLTIALTTLLVAVVLPGLSWAEAALVAAVLAPTDAALGKAVIDDESVPRRIRRSLNVESGLNDGLVLPAVLIFVALATGEQTTAGFWASFVVRQVILGAVLGVAVGGAGAWLLARAQQRAWVEGIYAQLATLALALLAFAGAQAAGANGFIAAFGAGLAFGAVGTGTDHLVEYTEDSGQLLAVVAFFVFGNVFVNDALGSLSVGVVTVAVLVLTAGRMVPVALVMTGTGAAAATKAFVGWFGPRGLASIAFGLLLLEEALPGGEQLFAIIALTVVASVVLHGASAAAGAQAYGRWWAAVPGSEQEVMPESLPVPPGRSRWSGPSRERR